MSHESYRIQFQGGPLDGCIIESISGDAPPISSLSITCDPVDNQERFIYYEPDEGYEDKELYTMRLTQDDYDDETPDECGVEDTEEEDEEDDEEGEEECEPRNYADGLD